MKKTVDRNERSAVLSAAGQFAAPQHTPLPQVRAGPEVGADSGPVGGIAGPADQVIRPS